MVLREQYEEHSERDFLSVPLATYHFEQVVIPLHWHREVEWIFTEQEGLIELEGQNYPYSWGYCLCQHGTASPHHKRIPCDSGGFAGAGSAHFAIPFAAPRRSLFLNKLEAGTLLFPLRVGKNDPGYETITRAFGECVRLLQTKEAGWEFSMQQELLTFLEAYWRNGHLLGSGAHPHNPQTVAVKESIAFMQHHFDQDLTLRQLADQAALSPSHYIRVFRHYTGQTPFAFSNDLRMQEAAHCLQQAMTVSETALRVGMPNISYFIRSFREKYGQTPKQYQMDQSIHS